MICAWTFSNRVWKKWTSRTPKKHKKASYSHNPMTKINLFNRERAKKHGACVDRFTFRSLLRVAIRERRCVRQFIYLCARYLLLFSLDSYDCHPSKAAIEFNIGTFFQHFYSNLITYIGNIGWHPLLAVCTRSTILLYLGNFSGCLIITANFNMTLNAG